MECGICFEKFPADVFKFLPCAHFICSFCYESLVKHECPYCRTSFETTPESDDEIYFQMIPIEHEEPKARKRKNKKKSRNFRTTLTPRVLIA